MWPSAIEAAEIIHRIGASGKTAQTVTLKGGLNVEQFWLDGSTLIGPNFQSDGPVSHWNDPAGGSPTRKITGFSEPFGATVSSAKSL